MMDRQARLEWLEQIAAYQDRSQSEEEFATFENALGKDREKRVLFLSAAEQSLALTEVTRSHAFSKSDGVAGDDEVCVLSESEELPTEEVGMRRASGSGNAWTQTLAYGVVGVVAAVALCLVWRVMSSDALSHVLMYVKQLECDGVIAVSGYALRPARQRTGGCFGSVRPQRRYRVIDALAQWSGT